MEKNVVTVASHNKENANASFNNLDKGNQSKLEIVEEEENPEENNQEENEEEDFQEVQGGLGEINELGEDAMNEYAEDEERYYNQLKSEFTNLQAIYERELVNGEITTLRMERLAEDIERDHILIEEYKEENGSLETFIKIEGNKNTTTLSSLQDSSIIDKVYSTIEYVDLSSLKKFSKNLIDSSGKNITESLSVLRGAGGEYLKRQAAVLYFLHLLKKRYAVTRIAQEAQEAAEQMEKSKAMFNGFVDLDHIRQFETKIKIVFNSESFLINLDNEDKKQNYTFRDLKEEACDVFGIRQEHRNSYHIVNDKFYVYSHRILVWDVHRMALETNRMTLSWVHMELIDKMSIFSDKMNNINKENESKSKTNMEQDMNKSRNLNELTAEELFTSEVEEYVRLYRRVEAVKLFFTKDLEKAAIIKKFADKIEVLAEERDRAKVALLLSADDEITEASLDKKFEEAKKVEDDKKKDELFRHIHKPELPIYLSMKTIFLFRLGKFWYFVMNLIFALAFFFKLNNNGVLDIRETYNIDSIITSIVIFNPIYKHFLRNEEALKAKSFKEMIRSKSELILWLNVLFNNLVMDTGVHLPDGIDTFNNFFQRDSTMYEVFNGMKFTFKSTQRFNPPDNSSFFKLPQNIIDDLTYFHEYQTKTEDTAPRFFNTDDYESLLDFDNLMCANCFSDGYLSYNSSESIFINEVGKYGDYLGGSYNLNLNYIQVRRSDFDMLVKLLKEILLLNQECLFFMISFNVVNIYNKALMKLDIKFEFSTIGDITVTLTSAVVDMQSDNSLFTQILEYIFLANVGILGFTLLLRWFTKTLVSKRIKTISTFALMYDTLLICLFTYYKLLTMESDVLKGSVLEQLNLTPDDYTPENTQMYNPDAFTYVDLNPIIDNDVLTNEISGITLLLLFLRLLFYLFGSPLIVYIIVLAFRAFKAIFNIFIVLVLFVLSFSLILHTVLGFKLEMLSSLNTSVLTSLISLLGGLKSGFGDLSVMQSFIVIGFLFVIKFLLITFILAIIKETYDEISIAYINYNKREHFRLAGETVFLFLKYLLIPVSLYSMVKEYLHHKNLYGTVNMEKFVREEELRRNFIIFIFSWVDLSEIVHREKNCLLNPSCQN